MKKKYKRLNLILTITIFISFGLWLILKNFDQNIVFFYTPTEIIKKNIINKTIRIGGIVKEESISKIDNSLTTNFILTDQNNNINVTFKGMVPSLFREQQGIVAKGIYDGNIFKAEELLTKHDENYIPPKK